MVIFFYSTIAFGIVTYSINNERDFNLQNILIASYDINLGQITHEGSLDWAYIIFLFATIFNVIVMLNLLISILGDSFDKFQISAIEFDYLEMAEALRDIEIALKILYSNRNTYDKDYHYVIACDKSIELHKKDWEGKILMIEKHIENTIQPLFIEIKHIGKYIREREAQKKKKEKRKLDQKNEVLSNTERISKKIINEQNIIFDEMGTIREEFIGVTKEGIDLKEKIINLENMIKEQAEMLKQQSNATMLILDQLEALNKKHSPV